MLIDARSLEQNKTIETDMCILARSYAKVSQCNLCNSGNFDLRKSRSKGIAGTIRSCSFEVKFYFPFDTYC